MTIEIRPNFNMGKFKAALEQVAKQMDDARPAMVKVGAGLEVLSGTVRADAQTTKRAQATVYRNARNCVAGDELFRVGEMWVRFVELPDGVCVWLPEGRDATAYLSINGVKPIRPGRAIDTTGEEKAAREAGERLSGAILRAQFPTPSEMRARDKANGSGLFPTQERAQEIADRVLRDAASQMAADRDRTWGSTIEAPLDLSPSDRDAELKQRLRPPAPRAKATLPEPRPARKRKLAKPEEEL